MVVSPLCSLDVVFAGDLVFVPQVCRLGGSEKSLSDILSAFLYSVVCFGLELLHAFIGSA